MRRRNLLVAMGGLTALAGCSSSDSSGTDQNSTTQTTTPEQLSDGLREGIPEIEQLNLVPKYGDYGDVVGNEIESVGQGGVAVVAFRYKMPVHDGKTEEFIETSIYHNGSSFDSKTRTDEDLVDVENGAITYERSEPFETENWDTGTYSAEVIARDEISNKNSKSQTIEFEILEPLGAGDAEVTSVETPPNVQKGDDVSFTVNLKNNTSRDNSIVSPISVRYENGEWNSFDEKLRLNIPAGGTGEYEPAGGSYSAEGTFEYRLDAIDETWSITVGN